VPPHSKQTQRRKRRPRLEHERRAGRQRAPGLPQRQLAAGLAGRARRRGRRRLGRAAPRSLARRRRGNGAAELALALRAVRLRARLWASHGVCGPTMHTGGAACRAEELPGSTHSPSALRLRPDGLGGGLVPSTACCGARHCREHESKRGPVSDAGSAAAVRPVCAGGGARRACMCWRRRPSGNGAPPPEAPGVPSRLRASRLSLPGALARRRAATCRPRQAAEGTAAETSRAPGRPGRHGTLTRRAGSACDGLAACLLAFACARTSGAACAEHMLDT